MRILAIRGCNLASLAGEFEIDLAHGPLGAAGVFAIVGPTGAGKSTLLDAMCVALFDRTPRLANRSTVVVGRGDDDPTALGAQDVRSLLRRGASAGYAEVDFESGDARRYRARWSVRRARNATDGRFQNQQVTLTTLAGSDGRGEAGAQLGGTKTETLEAIHQRLGLSFDQFRRSALLAQGDFAAFLRADGKDRSELLERMTGTEIYTRLSVAAHVKAGLAEQQLRERHGAALAIAVLADDDRTRAEHELVLAKQAQGASRERLAAAERAARWLDESTRRERALAAAQASRAAADAALEQAASDRAELVLRRRAETLRAVWDEAARLDRQLALAQAETFTSGDAAALAQTALLEIDERRTRLAQRHAPISNARIAAGLVERNLSADGAAADRATGRPSRLPTRKATKPADLESRLPSSHVELEERARAAAPDASWLVARQALGIPIAGWPELDGRLAQQATLAAELVGADKLLSDRLRHREQLAIQRKGAAGDHQQALARLVEAQGEAAGFEKKRGLSLDAARRAEDEARRRCTDVDHLTALVGDARQAATSRSELDSQLVELAAQATLDVDRRQGAELARDEAATLRAERTRMVEELRKASGYEHARAELVEGDPCPLCGAEEHPWHDRGSFDALIIDAQQRLAEAIQRGEAALAILATVAARDAHRTLETARIAKMRATADGSIATATTKWRDQLAALGELLLVDDPSSDAALQLAHERSDTARARLEAARAARSQAEAVAKAASDAIARVQARQADVEHQVNAVREVDSAIATLDAAIARLRGERAGKLDRHAELLDAIDAAFGRWLDALPTDEGANAVLELARTALAPVIAAAADRSGPLATGSAHGLPSTAKARPRDASTLATDDRARPTDASTHATDAHARPSDASTHVTDAHVGAVLARSRKVLADLASAWARRADIVATLDAELRSALAATEQASREAERHVADAVARRDAASSRREAAIAELAESASRLDTARVAAGLDAEELRRLLVDSATRVEQLAQHLEALDRAADRARTLVGERSRHLDDHRAASPFAPQPVDRAEPEDGVAPDARQSGDLAADIGDARRSDDLAADARPSDALAAAARRLDNLAADARGLDDLAAAVSTADHHAAALAATLAADADARTRRSAALAQFAAAEQAVEVDRVLGEVIGSHDGKLFRSFAQSLTLDGLLAVANSHLEELAPRYQLERVPKHDLELQVIDRDLGNEIRSVQSLSGGESFLVSLALALGLSSMSAHDVRVRTLLIDEGFGTLDPATLDGALAVLDALQATGRQVGVISHVPALVERVGAHVRVSPRGGGKSDVIVAES